MIQEPFTFCTIVTEDYLTYAETLSYSLNKLHSETLLQIFISDVRKNEFKKIKPDCNCELYFIDDLCEIGIGKEIFEQYHSIYHDGFRWSMKPVFLNYLILEKGYKKVIYVDCDIHFFEDYLFLFEELDNSSFLLTPHWRSSDPYSDLINFSLLFTDGIYNGGFIGVSSSGTDVLCWWAKACLYKCKKDAIHGFHDDQRYLDAIPVIYDNVKIIRHKGCNVANWNRVECKRVLQVDGQVLINDVDPIIFIHFTASTIKGILSGEDEYLLPYLETYATTINSINPKIDLFGKYNPIVTNSASFPIQKQSIIKKAFRKIKSYFS